MTAGTINLRATDLEDRDQAERQSVIDGDGYEWHFGPNEGHTLADNSATRMMAANATVKFGQSTQQATAPEVLADVDDVGGIS